MIKNNRFVPKHNGYSFPALFPFFNYLKENPMLNVDQSSLAFFCPSSRVFNSSLWRKHYLVVVWGDKFSITSHVLTTMQDVTIKIFKANSWVIWSGTHAANVFNQLFISEELLLNHVMSLLFTHHDIIGVMACEISLKCLLQCGGKYKKFSTHCGLVTPCGDINLSQHGHT